MKRNGTIGNLVWSVRKKLGVTQKEFATQYGITLGTLRNWEQSVCDPDGIAILFLRLLDQEPKVIARLLKKHELLTC